jgi:hypothetical protein
MDYVLKPGQPVTLPPYTDAHGLRLAIPRPNTPLAGTLPKHMGSDYTLRGMSGQMTADLVYGENDCCVMPQVGYHSPVHMASFSTPPHPSRHLPYRRGDQVEVTPQRPIASVLAPLWNPAAPQSVKVFEVYRQLPALVFGQVPEDVDGTWWLTTDTGIWLLEPGSYIVREMNGYGGRTIPPTFFVREFAQITELEGGVVADFPAPTG